MRKFNVKLFLILMAGVVVLGGALFGIHYLQYRRIGTALLYQADRAEEQGQTERMATYLQRYLEFAPQDGAARKRLGLAWASDAFLSNPRTRLKGADLLNQVLINDPNQPDVHKAIVRVALYPNTPRPKMARDHLQPLWDEAQRPGADLDKKERGDLESCWGQLLELESKPVEAMMWYRQAREHNPEDTLNYVRLAVLLRKQPEVEAQQRLKNFAEADQLMDALVDANQESYKAHLARWSYRREFDLLRFPGTSLEMQALMRRYAPGAAGALLTDQKAWTEALLKRAGEDVEAAIKRAPEELDVLLAAADLERQKGAVSPDAQTADQHRKEARSYLQLGLQLQTKQGYRGAGEPAKFLLLWHLANVLLDTRQVEETARADAPPVDHTQDLTEAADAIAQLRQLHTLPAGTTEYLEGRLFREQRRWAEAAARFEQARPLFAKRGELVYEIDMQLSECYTKLEEPGLVLAACERAIKWDPNSAHARLGMGSALWNMGREEEAIKNYQSAMERGQVPAEGWLDIARLQVLVQLRREANERDWRAAEAALERAESATPKLVDVKLLKAEVLAAQDKIGKASTFLREALAESPNEVELWVALAGLASHPKNPEKDPDGAIKVLDEATKLAGDRVELRLARGRAALRQWRDTDPKGADLTPEQRMAREKERDQKLVATLEKMEQDWPSFKPAEQTKLLDGLAEGQFVSGHIRKAREMWSKLATIPPNQTDLRLRLLLFDLAIKLDDAAGIDEALKDIEAIEHGHGAYHRFGQALRQLWLAKQPQTERKDERLTEARLLLDQAANMRPTWSRIALARAEIEEMRGNPEESISFLKKAIEQGETSPAVIQRLVSALVQRQRYGEADEELNRLRKSMLLKSELGKLAADVALRRGNYARAYQLADEAVSPESKNVRDLMWHARLLFVANKDQDAIRKIQQAIALSDTEPEPYVAWVQFLAARGGKRDEAEKALTTLREKVPPGKATLALAQCYEALGDMVKARECYDAAMQQHPGDVDTLRTTASFYLKTGRVNEVVPVLRAVASGKTKASPENTEWARRALAVVLAASLNYDQFKEALQLVGLQLDDNGQLARDTAREESTDAIRAKARVLATQTGQRQFRERAIELLESLGRRGALQPDDKYILALLYDSSNTWTKSREQLKELSMPLTQDKQPRYLTQASQYMNRYILGLIRNGDYKEAEGVLDRLDAYEKQQGVQQGGFGTIELRAQLLEKTGDGDKAVSLLTDYVRLHRDTKDMILVVIGSLVRQKRYDDALALLLKEIDTCHPEMAGAAYVSLLHDMNPSDDQCVRAEKWLKERLEQAERQMQQKPDPRLAEESRVQATVLRQHLANLYDMRGHYPEAEDMYRKILQDHQTNVLALNNLSWLLAQRTGDGKAALELIDRAITNMGRRADLLDTRGVVYLALGEPEKALSDFKEATTDERTPTHLFHLARAHFAAKDRATALKVLVDARSAGLEPSKLHPVEQLSCRQLMTELKVD